MLPYIERITGALKTQDTGLAFRFDGSASPVLYLGEAQPGSLSSSAVWRIQKVDTSSGVIITWANGSKEFVNVWDNRLSLSYS